MSNLPINAIINGLDDRLRVLIKEQVKQLDDGLIVSVRYLVRHPEHLTYSRDNVRYKVDHELLDGYHEEMDLLAKNIASTAPLIERSWDVVHRYSARDGHVFVIGTAAYITKHRPV